MSPLFCKPWNRGRPKRLPGFSGTVPIFSISLDDGGKVRSRNPPALSRSGRCPWFSNESEQGVGSCPTFVSLTNCIHCLAVLASGSQTAFFLSPETSRAAGTAFFPSRERTKLGRHGLEGVPALPANGPSGRRSTRGSPYSRVSAFVSGQRIDAASPSNPPFARIFKMNFSLAGQTRANLPVFKVTPSLVPGLHMMGTPLSLSLSLSLSGRSWGLIVGRSGFCSSKGTPERSHAAITRSGYKRVIPPAQCPPPLCPHKAQGTLDSSGCPLFCPRSFKPC